MLILLQHARLLPLRIISRLAEFENSAHFQRCHGCEGLRRRTAKEGAALPRGFCRIRDDGNYALGYARRRHDASCRFFWSTLANYTRQK